ncbi:MAG: hypothetical protein JWR60_1028 [Polaromonas sp.]|nr:hypothetical protein [Polaromonas sp.]
MANPHSNTKMTGDTHLPDVEAELPLQEGGTGALGADGTPQGRGSADGGGPGRGVNKAGILKESDTAAGGNITKGQGGADAA